MFLFSNLSGFSPESIRLIDELVDQVTRDGRACAMITTNQEYVSKLLTFSIPTIAVIRGHAVGAGCIFALAHVYRLMISSRGYIFMNEIDLGLPLTPGIMAVLRSKLHPSSFQEAILTGKRYNGKEAAAAGIVHVAAMEYETKNWKREVFHALKMEMFKTTVRELENGGVGFARM
ncbi:unnamed protein product [Ilex paraguariensis]|uniref:Uncharacterized protein n=1 Tax=Ilex paraguariensis TaxID=185542 RepID=A0ABC8QS15_9AQUA